MWGLITILILLALNWIELFVCGRWLQPCLLLGSLLFGVLIYYFCWQFWVIDGACYWMFICPPCLCCCLPILLWFGWYLFGLCCLFGCSLSLRCSLWLLFLNCACCFATWVCVLCITDLFDFDWLIVWLYFWFCRWFDVGLVIADYLVVCCCICFALLVCFDCLLWFGCLYVCYYMFVILLWLD